jgi:PiT family inorganic phosphate transporter
LVGSLIGVAVGNAFARSRSVEDGVHWAQLWKVLEALALSPILGFLLAGALYYLCRRYLHDKHQYEPVKDTPPVWWMRGILIATCSGVSFAHGTNDGQKSIGLIMLTIIGLFPATFSINPDAQLPPPEMAGIVRDAEPLIERYGDDQKQAALDSARAIERADGQGETDTSMGRPRLEPGPNQPREKQRTTMRDDVYQLISQLRYAEEAKGIDKNAKKQAEDLARRLGKTVEYAPLWVRLLSAVCLGVGTMIGYKRIVTTLGERLGSVHLTPAQGASAELVSAALISVAGLTGLPVSTTHIVTSGIAGTMVSSGAGLQYKMVSRIVIAWVLTLPVTIVISGILYYVLAGPVCK